MKLENLIAECSAYDFKLMLEENRPKSWLKSVSAFANGLGGSLFFGIDDNEGIVKSLNDVQRLCDAISNIIRDYIEKRVSGLTRIFNETKALDRNKEELDPVFKSTPTHFKTIIYATADAGNSSLKNSIRSFNPFFPDRR